MKPIVEEDTKMDWREIASPATRKSWLANPSSRVRAHVGSNLFLAGWPMDGRFDKIIEAYPHISREDILQRVAFAAEMMHEEQYHACTRPVREARLIVNENFPVPALLRLRERGVDAPMSVQKTCRAHPTRPFSCEPAKQAAGSSPSTGIMESWCIPERARLHPQSFTYDKNLILRIARQWILGLLDNPADATGYMVVIGGEQTIRRRPLAKPLVMSAPSSAAQTYTH
ncbi:MAG: hypothetical protein MZU91_08360 [Desulfosudis oleivorans]|nr:hypothetical protein [Desulfosudis oleivorans]